MVSNSPDLNFCFTRGSCSLYPIPHKLVLCLFSSISAKNVTAALRWWCAARKRQSVLRVPAKNSSSSFQHLLWEPLRRALRLLPERVEAAATRVAQARAQWTEKPAFSTQPRTTLGVFKRPELNYISSGIDPYSRRDGEWLNAECCSSHRQFPIHLPEVVEPVLSFQPLGGADGALGKASAALGIVHQHHGVIWGIEQQHVSSDRISFAY